MEEFDDEVFKRKIACFIHILLALWCIYAYPLTFRSKQKVYDVHSSLTTCYLQSACGVQMRRLHYLHSLPRSFARMLVASRAWNVRFRRLRVLVTRRVRGVDPLSTDVVFTYIMCICTLPHWIERQSLVLAPFRPEPMSQEFKPSTLIPALLFHALSRRRPDRLLIRVEMV